ncbi:hypothetical protein H6G17_29725 [Chroococcidiopsis sp. FACHB-1243]|nr:hypothetical protein [Chroococcidiopsis sp. [FACHB-1243]]
MSGHGRSDRATRVSRTFRVPSWTSHRWHLPLGRRGGGACGRLRLGVVGRAMTAPRLKCRSQSIFERLPVVDLIG